MDPITIKNTVEVLVTMREKDLLPKRDFRLRDIQGPAALYLNKSLPTAPLACALSALGVAQRPDGRFYSRPLMKGVESYVAQTRELATTT